MVCLISNLLHISNINIRVTLTVYLIIIDSAEQCEMKLYIIGFYQDWLNICIFLMLWLFL